jgi:3-hydroxyisobutyrate dehydrogenase
MKVGFVGLGAMGAPMARNLARHGFLHGVWNRTRSVGEELAAELGVSHAKSLADLAAESELVLVCVSADRDVQTVVKSLLPGLAPGRLVIDHSTVGVRTARALADLVRQHGADFLDAPVSGGVEGARQGSLSMMVGGRVASLAAALPALSAMAAKIVHMGEVGAGQAAKAVNQIMCAGINQAVTEALGFGLAQGLDMEKVISVVSGGAAGNWFLEKRGRSMVSGTFAPGFKLALHYKDLKLCEEMAAAAGYPLPLTEMTLKEYRLLMDGGFGDEDISALFRRKRPE